MNLAKGKLEDLKKRLLFTLFTLGIFRVATQIPSPGVDRSALLSYFEGTKGSLLDVFNTFSGGALEQYSVVALGIMPYISSSIIFSLLTATFPALAEIQKEPDGYKKINRYTRYGTLVLCLIQGFGLASFIEVAKSPSGIPVVLEPGAWFKIVSLISFTAGTMFIMWLGEQITERGIGNGISLIIFTGIAAGIPSGMFNTLNLFRSGELKGVTLFIVLLLIFISFFVIIFIERAFRKVPVQYAKKVINNRVYGGQASHLPIKINISGVIPPIFASSILSFPTTLGNLVPRDTWISPFLLKLQEYMYPGSMLFNVVFVCFIVFFAYFYVPIQFKTGDIAEGLKNNGGFVPGIRPGTKTVEFLNYVTERLTLAGGIYLSIICVLPTILATKAKVPFYFGGTSLLILVGVAIDTIEKVQSSLISQRLDTAYKARGKYSGGRRF